MQLLIDLTKKLEDDSPLKSANLIYLINQAAGSPRQRSEITGADGADLVPSPVKEATTEALRKLLRKL